MRTIASGEYAFFIASLLPCPARLGLGQSKTCATPGTGNGGQINVTRALRVFAQKSAARLKAKSEILLRFQLANTVVRKISLKNAQRARFIY
jgi:hypothetical protein